MSVSPLIEIACTKCKIRSVRKMTLTPKSSIAQDIHNQARTIPRFRRTSSTARPQESDHDVLAHPGIPPIRETVIHVLVVEATLAIFGLPAERTIDPVSAAVVWCGGGGSACGESCDSLIWSPLP